MLVLWGQGRGKHKTKKVLAGLIKNKREKQLKIEMRKQKHKETNIMRK